MRSLKATKQIENKLQIAKQCIGFHLEYVFMAPGEERVAHVYETL